MIPKDKAKELVHKMYGDEFDYMTEGQAKQCALIAVDEILKVSIFFKLIAETEYWNEVKEEIEKL